MGTCAGRCCSGRSEAAAGTKSVAPTCLGAAAQADRRPLLARSLWHQVLVLLLRQICIAVAVPAGG